MSGQKKNYKIDGRIARLLRPIYQMREFKGTLEFPWVEYDVNIKIQIVKSYKYKEFKLTLDATWILSGIWEPIYGVSVEGWDSWKETVYHFLECVKDNFWRDYENDCKVQNE